MQGFRYQPEILQGVPEQLTQPLKQYEDWFTVDGDKLKEITAYFVDELAKGLSIEGGSIVSTMWTGTVGILLYADLHVDGHSQ
jgi:hexokinase